MLSLVVAAVALAGTTTASAELPPGPWLMPRNGTYDPSVITSGILPCEALKAAGLGDRLLFATDAGYEPQIESWYSANARMRPYCLVLPQSTDEVSTALTALVNANDGAGDWHVAIRSGGHGWPGSNNIADGVTIDLTMMNSSSYDKQANLAKIQPGGRWGNVYTDLLKDGVTATGGRDGDVGVGGFLLGGGNSFFSGRMGFGCDSVVNFEVVLANGTIVNANNTTNSDLWRALKGGGSNFGIVTRYDMEAIPAKDIYYELRYLSGKYSDDVVDAVVGFTNQDQSLADNALITFYSHNTSVSPDTIIGLIHVNTQGNANSSTAFDKLKTLPSLVNVSTVESMAKAALGSQVPGDSNNVGTTLTFRNDPKIIRRCVELHEEYVETLKRSINPDKFKTFIFFQPLPSYMAQISHQKGGNMLGLDSVPYNGILWSTGVAVDTSEGDAALAIAQVETSIFTARVKEATRSLNGDMDFIYLNYADASQDALGSYGAANIEHMRDVAAAYDPTKVFQKRIPGGFKISRVASD
ncbi:FAD binding domain-containing protein [Annulohypoxylon maeteangense]|uniref:FAD binding domain-containing protein n=1 Tax=Annulohypoxylon maeteangense TaxID=1927788 RepID=UPI002007BD41|nr:FAD binding domain-containing protein [Annulohypoxylon maeteangense]KAI0887607.1 FAD binding domain-containing protein [Annulohypoxylon maeteangense]